MKNDDREIKRQRRSEASVNENKNNEHLKIFVTNLKKFRKDKGMTIRSLGLESGISFSTISEIESMITKPNFDTICALSNALKTPLFLFFLSEDEKIK